MNNVKQFYVLALMVSALMALFVSVTLPLRADGNLYVTPGGNDSNNCSSPATSCVTIQSAINKAVPGSTIYAAVGTYTDVTSPVVTLNKNVTLSGGWDTTFVTRTGFSVIHGMDERRVIEVNESVEADISYFEITHGKRDVDLERGGGIHNAGWLSAEHVNILDNTLGIGSGAAIYNARTGTLILNHAQISRNGAPGDGGGWPIQNSGIITATNIIVSENNGRYLGGIGSTIMNSPEYDSPGKLTLINSIIRDNNTAGAIINYGELTLHGTTIANHVGEDWASGGISNAGGIVQIFNSTLSNNKAENGGAFWNGGNGQILIVNSTIAHNNASAQGGSLYNHNIGNPTGAIHIQGTILSENTAQLTGPDCSGDIVSLGYNLVSNTSGCNLSATGSDMLNVPARLAPLGNYGGFAPTYPPLSTSPAIDGILTDAPGTCPAQDQRGVQRPVDGNGDTIARCDIGAVELHLLESSSLHASVLTASPGTEVKYLLTINSIGNLDVGQVLVTDTLPAAVTYVPDSLVATQGVYTYDNGAVTWQGNVDGNTPIYVSFAVTLNADVSLGTTVVNQTMLTGGGQTVSLRSEFEASGLPCNFEKHDSNPVLRPGSIGSWDAAGVSQPFILKQGTQYKMWYIGKDGSGKRRLGLATSNDGIIWNKHANNPLLTLGPDWTPYGIHSFTIAREGDLYHLLFTGMTTNFNKFVIAHTESYDGINWLDDSASVMISPDWGWDYQGVTDPYVVYDGAAYQIWYTGYDGVVPRLGRSITSSLGSSGLKDSANPIVNIGVPGSWDWLGVYSPRIVTIGSQHFLWYSAETLPLAWQTGFTTSRDFKTWTRQGLLISQGESGSFDVAGADYVAVIPDGSKYKVWYTSDDDQRYTIAYGMASACGQTLNPAVSFDVFLPMMARATSCGAYYTEDFSNARSGWPILSITGLNTGYVNGEYQVHVTETDSLQAITAGALAKDVTIEVRARRVAGSDGAYGISFGITPQWQTYYVALVSANSFSLWRYANGNWSPLANWTPDPVINTGTGQNHLKIIKQQNMIRFFINNKLVTSVSDTTLTDWRRVGVVVTSSETQASDVRFDDFRMSPACYP